MAAKNSKIPSKSHDLKIVTPQTHVTVERSDECTSYEVAMGDDIYQSGNLHDKGKHCTKNKDLTEDYKPCHLQTSDMDRSDHYKLYEVVMGEDIYPHEADNLQTHGAHCTKNPGHKEFIPVTEFNISHLPPNYKHKDVFEFIKKQADLTVRIITKFVSKDRPDEFPGSQHGGSECTLTGSGGCCSVRRCGYTDLTDPKYEVATGEDIYPHEADNLQTQGAHCTKNPGHKEFIPVTTFNISHLPLKLQHKDVFELIKKQADLTMRIITKFVSKDRPDEFPGSQYRGSECTLTGTGCCWFVERCGYTDLTDPKYEVATGEDIYPHEADNLQTQGAHCTKNPGHKEFIPVTTFNISHLPLKLQHKDVFELIKKQADLTMRIITKFVSKDRPDEFPGSQYRGSECTLTGTGCCWFVERCGYTDLTDPKYEVATGEDIYPHEADNLQTQGAHCTKNPGHKEFIPVTTFNISHLPLKLQHKDVFELIKKQADLTMRIITKFVSKDRPDEFPGSQYRGSECTLTGTGCCWFVERCGYTARSDQFCQCQACKQSGQPETSWWEVHVYTAAHVVFDDVEAANTEVVFFYDDTESQTIKIQGTRVKEVNVERDRCHLVCVVHVGEMDEVMNKLDGMCWDEDWVGRELEKKYRKEGFGEHCLIISHPHGSTKQVSVGKMLEDEKDRNGWLVCCYDVPTCPGSSGAVVPWNYLLGLWGLPHSKGGQDGIGRSGSNVSE